MVRTIDILVNLDGEHCQDKLSMFGEKENKKLNVLHGKMYSLSTAAIQNAQRFSPNIFVCSPSRFTRTSMVVLPLVHASYVGVAKHTKTFFQFLWIFF
jgi:hypothetical protein